MATAMLTIGAFAVSARGTGPENDPSREVVILQPIKAKGHPACMSGGIGTRCAGGSTGLATTTKGDSSPHRRLLQHEWLR